jgi:hypothetical protein
MARTATARKAKPSTSGSNRPANEAGNPNRSTTVGSNRPTSVAAFPLELVEGKEAEVFVPWDEAVAEGKKLVADYKATEEQQHQRQMRLGELADTVERKYKDETFTNFAKEVGCVACTLERHRDVWRAWKGAPGRVLEVVKSKYAVARELATLPLPKRYEVVEANPSITKAKAVEVMRDFRRDEVVANPIAHRRSEKKKWWDAILKLANNAVRQSSEITGDDHAILRGGVVDPKSIANIKDGAYALFELAEDLEKLFPDIFERTDA